MSRRLIAIVPVALALAAGGTAVAKPGAHELVVRGEDNLSELACNAAGVCEAQVSDGRSSGTLGIGTYQGSMRLYLRDAFDNGEGGKCAPAGGRLVFAGRLVVALAGNSCQDGAGDPTKASFTGLFRFRVVNGHGHGTAVVTEDANDHEHLTLIGTIR
ncbi:MAG TPA: hypothetical protein VH418_03440 [Solirubrobacteraceae bacterium]|jgi:hypothetical protein